MKLRKIIFGLFVMVMSVQSFQAMKLQDIQEKIDKYTANMKEKDSYLERKLARLEEFVEWENEDPQARDCRVKDGIMTLPDGLFKGYNFIKSIKFNQVTYIPNNVCSKCQNLVSVDTGDAIGIGCRSFKGCLRLESIDIGKAIKIGDGAFSGCTRLLMISIPNVNEIGKQAFASCSQLRHVYAPSLECIKGFTFIGCTKMGYVYVPRVKYTDIGAFYSGVKHASDCTFVINNECKIGPDTFIGRTDLSFKFLRPPENITPEEFTEYSKKNIEIDKTAFYGCSNSGKPLNIKFLINNSKDMDPSELELELPYVVFSSDCKSAKVDKPAYLKDLRARKLIFEDSSLLDSIRFKFCRSLEQVDLDFDLTQDEAEAFLNMRDRKRKRNSRVYQMIKSCPIFENCIRLRAVNIRKQAVDMIGQILADKGVEPSEENIRKAVVKSLNMPPEGKLNVI